MEQSLSSESHLSLHVGMQQTWSRGQPAPVKVSLVATIGCFVHVRNPTKSCLSLLLALG